MLLRSFRFYNGNELFVFSLSIPYVVLWGNPSPTKVITNSYETYYLLFRRNNLKGYWVNPSFFLLQLSFSETVYSLLDSCVQVFSRSCFVHNPSLIVIRLSSTLTGFTHRTWSGHRESFHLFSVITSRRWNFIHESLIIPYTLSLLAVMDYLLFI